MSADTSSFNYCMILNLTLNECSCSSQLVPSISKLPICAVDLTCLPIQGHTS